MDLFAALLFGVLVGLALRPAVNAYVLRKLAETYDRLPVFDPEPTAVPDECAR